MSEIVGDEIRFEIPFEMPEDKPIYVRVLGQGKIFWYVIEGEPPAGEASDSEGIMIECRSECDRIRQLSIPGSDFDLHDPKSSLSLGFFSNNLLVLQSRFLLLIGGDVDTRKYGNVQDETVGMGFRHLNVANKSDWVVEGGYQEHQFGGAAVAPDGSIYSVGYNQYVMSPIGYWERLPTPPLRRQDGTLYETRLLGVTLKKLIIYTLGGGLHHANVMLSFDLESGQWDEDFLDDNFWGEWSAGVVLYNDRYLFTFGDRSPKPSMSKVPLNEEEGQEPSYLDEEEVPGIYVFDLERGQWLPEPVEGLENNGTILPTVYKPNPELCCARTFSPYLFQIGNHDNRRLALLWDGHGRHPTSDLPQCEITWSKFILTASTTTTDQTIHFSAHVLSNGFCPLAEFTSQVLNCAV